MPDELLWLLDCRIHSEIVRIHSAILRSGILSYVIKHPSSRRADGKFSAGFSIDPAQLGTLRHALSRISIRRSMRGKGRNEYVVGRYTLSPENGADLDPGADHSSRWRQILLDELMKLAEIVTRNSNVHMVLNMVIHVPVQEPNQRVGNKCPRAQPEILRKILQSDMLRVIAEEEQTSSIKRSQSYQQYQYPELERQSGHDDARMPYENCPRPIHGCSAFLRRRLREQLALPFALESAARYPQLIRQCVPKSDRAYECVLQKVLYSDRNRNNDLQIFRRMKSRPMVPDMARFEYPMIDPSEKCKQISEELVQPARLEDGVVSQLVDGVDHERETGPVHEK
jgi:hypothetical protein